jgi:uncharacterized protein YaaR (DUF327 family)
MRIESRPVGNREKLKKDKTAQAKVSFLETIQGMDETAVPSFDPEDVSESDMKNLAGLIEQFGEGLSQNPTPENFMRYKKHIRVFLSIANENLEIINIRSRNKIHMVVEEIDSGLQKLAQLVLSGEKDRLTYLKLLGQMKGLIIDLIS